MQVSFIKIVRLLAALCLFEAVHASAAVLYVDLNSANPVSPFSSWATAATNIQDAVDAASSGDQVLVTNGIYQTGGRPLPGYALTNRLILTNSVIVQSVNGPLATTIAGYQIPGDITGNSAVRCVYLAKGAALAGFTITRGATHTGGNDVQDGGDTSGAGILCPLGDPSTVSNCILVSNIAGDFAGGIYGGTLYNCLVISNSALLGSYGGGTFAGNYYNCTINANSAGIGAGDAFGNLVNCIVYGNNPADQNYGFSTLNYCCTSPDPGGTGNIVSDPLFANPAAGNFHLRPGSPCVDAGNNASVSSATDLTGNPRIANGTVDIGAYETQSHFVNQNSINPVSPFSSWATASTDIQSAIDAASDGDLILVANGVYQTGGRVVFGSLTNRVAINKAVIVQSVNGAAVTAIRGNQPMGDNAVRCVYLTNNAMLVGFTLTNGATRNSGDTFQEKSGAAVWCASSNAIISQCVAISNKAAVYGGGVYSGTLNNSTLSSNTAFAGGGAYSSVLNDCLLVGNSGSDGGGAGSCVLNGCVLTNNSAGYGGGASNSKLNNCLVAGNHAGEAGGGVNGDTYNASTLINCTVISNTAGMSPAGVSGGCALSNCIVYFNTPGNGAGVSTSRSCTTPLPPGVGNITSNPLFVNPTAGDFRLQSDSPCINAGNNSYIALATDLDGNPRISGGTVDIGAYEFQNPASIISYAWLGQYGLPTDGSVDFLDPDGDGFNNWQEWIAGTDPANASSVLQMLAPAPSGTNLVVTWQSVANITYSVQRATDLTADPAFSTIATNIPGQSGTTSYTDTNAPPPGPYYYRVGVQ